MEYKAHPDSELSQEQLSELALKLSQKYQELTDQVKELELKLTRKEDCSLADPAEAAFLREEADRAQGLLRQYRENLAQIHAATSRLENGVYGVSVSTGEPIPYPRLQLLPWASE